jgi:hypothetical protein
LKEEMNNLKICLILPPTSFLGYPVYEPALVQAWLKTSPACRVDVFEMNILLLEGLWRKLEGNRQLSGNDRLFLLKGLSERLEPDVNPRVFTRLTTGETFAREAVNTSNQIDAADAVIFTLQEFRVYENYDYFGFLCRCIRKKNPRCRIIFTGSALSKYDPVQLAFIRAKLPGDILIIPGNNYHALRRAVPDGPAMPSGSGTGCDEWPAPDYSGFAIERYINFRAGTPILSITASTGCTRRCVFCNMWCIAPYGIRSPQKVSLEMTRLNREYGIRIFRFNDNMLPEDDHYLKQVFEPVARECPWATWLAAVFPGANLREDTLAIMKASGCYMLWLGIETGSPRLLERMKKPYTHGQAIKLMKRIKKSGINVGIYLIADFPGETPGDLEMTVNFITQNKEFIDDVWAQTYFVAGGSSMQRGYEDFPGIRRIDPVSFCYDSNGEPENYINNAWIRIIETVRGTCTGSDRAEGYVIPTINRMPILTEI